MAQAGDPRGFQLQQAAEGAWLEGPESTLTHREEGACEFLPLPSLLLNSSFPLAPARGCQLVVEALWQFPAASLLLWAALNCLQGARGCLRRLAEYPGARWNPAWRALLGLGQLQPGDEEDLPSCATQLGFGLLSTGGRKLYVTWGIGSTWEETK